MPAYLLLIAVSYALTIGAFSLARSLDLGRPALYLVSFAFLPLLIWHLLSVGIGVVIIYAALLRHRADMSAGHSFLAGWLPGTVFLTMTFFLILMLVRDTLEIKYLISIKYFTTLLTVTAIATWLGVTFGQRLVTFGDPRTSRL